MESVEPVVPVEPVEPVGRVGLIVFTLLWQCFKGDVRFELVGKMQYYQILSDTKIVGSQAPRSPKSFSAELLWQQSHWPPSHHSNYVATDC